MNKKIKSYGPWAVVTGASSGIGREIAIKLAEAGLNLVLVARSQKALDQLALELTSWFSIEARVIAADLAHKADVERVKTATVNLDVGLLIAAAGFGTSGPFLDSNLDQELEMLNLNCQSVLLMSQEFGRRFSRRGRGGIILISSILAFQGNPYSAHYAATKAYVQALAEALNVELAPLGVDVLASAPGPTKSGFAGRAGQRMRIALEPAVVAEQTLDALGRKSTVLPGFLSKILVYAMLPVPRWARIRIMGLVMVDMTKDRLARNGESTSE